MKKLAIASLMLISTSVFAHNLPVDTIWKSDYITGKGSINLRVISNENISVMEDRNHCFFNNLGHIAGCTFKYFTPKKGKLVVKPVATDRMTLVYSLENSDYEVVHNLAEETKGFIRLLKVNQEGQVIDSVRLFKD
jgi:hypothetical protein